MRDNFDSTLPQFDALAELHYLDKPLSMTELSTRLMVSNGNITGLVDRLVRNNYAMRVPDDKDRRVKLIVVTDEGKKIFKKMASAHEKWIKEIFEDLSLDDINDMSTLLKHVHTRLAK